MILLLNLSPESASRTSVGDHGRRRRFPFLNHRFRFAHRCHHRCRESLDELWRVIEAARHLKALDAEKPGLLPRMMINLSQGFDMVGDKLNWDDAHFAP